MSHSPHEYYLIEGRKPLNGSVTVSGAKNAITKQLVASILTTEVCEFTNVPRNHDVNITLEMLAAIGSEYIWTGQNSISIQTPSIKSNRIVRDYSGSNRIPILFLGPLIHRSGAAKVPMMAGCEIGPRPIDFHIGALKVMGAEVKSDSEGFSAEALHLYGNVIELPYPSVGATENIILTAVLSEGLTTITNAAIEPEILDTILLLQKMGALIQVDSDRKISIEGVKELKGAKHSVIPDRIEAASFAVAAIITNGRIKVHGAEQEHLMILLNSLRKIGAGYEVDGKTISFFKDKDVLSGIYLETDVYPGFATDWQPPLVALLTQAQGISIIHETVYENRFGYTSALKDLGANIGLSNVCLGGKPCRFKNQNYSHSCTIQGASPLTGTEMAIPDLRAGFAYLVGALAAKGISKLSGVTYIERGYENIFNKLHELGAQIEAR